MQFHEFIKQKREQLGYTQTEVGEKANCHATSICAYEKGASRPMLETALKIAKALEIETKELEKFNYHFVKKPGQHKNIFNTKSLRMKFAEVLQDDHPICQRMKINIEPLLNEIEEKVNELEKYYDLLKM